MKRITLNLEKDELKPGDWIRADLPCHSVYWDVTRKERTCLVERILEMGIECNGGGRRGRFTILRKQILSAWRYPEKET